MAAKPASKTTRKTAAKPSATAPAPAEVITAYKGFDAQLRCRGRQYAIGATATHEGPVEPCASGLHACEYPLDVLGYYAPAGDNGTLNRFAVVEASGAIARHGGDSKIAAARLTIKAELRMPDLVRAAIAWITDRIDRSIEQQVHGGTASNTGNRSAASNTGNRSAASNTGYQSAASNTGDYSAASNTGDYSAASNTGDYSAASNTGDYSAASNTGNRSAASNTGNRSAASNTGDYSAARVDGRHSVAMASGYQSRVRACAGSAIVAVYRNDEGELLHIRAAITGQDGVKPDTWYTLDADGQFVECADEVAA